MIELIDVTKYYRSGGSRKTVINNVSFRFEPGTSYGILGGNGSGKSTLIRVLAGTEPLNRGTIRRTVRVSWPLGLRMFHPRLTGRENVRFVARTYGADVKRVSEFVEDFAELGEYINMPVNTYSSGMNARLAFGLSLAIDFDVYLIDEVIAVGDARFQARCKEMFAARRKVSDVIMVSHQTPILKDYCTQGALLSNGRLVPFESLDQAISAHARMNG